MSQIFATFWLIVKGSPKFCTVVPNGMKTIERTIYAGNEKVHTASISFTEIEKFGQIGGPNTLDTFENFD